RPRRRGRGATPRPEHVSVSAAQGESRRNELALQLQRFNLVQRRLQRLRRAVQVERLSDYSQKYSTTSAASTRACPKAIQPCLPSMYSSRLRRISASPSAVTQVPLVLWSLRIHLSERRSMVQWDREAAVRVAPH